MGVNNKQRRAAKQRKRARRGAGGSSPKGGGAGYSYDDGWNAFTAQQAATGLVHDVIREISGDVRAARAHAESLTGRGCPAPRAFVVGALRETLNQMVADCVRGGWTPADLAEIIRRRASGQQVPELAGLLLVEVGRHSGDRVSPQWRADLEGLGRSDRLDLETTAGIERALRLAAVLSILPPITCIMPAPGSASLAEAHQVAAGDRRQLARVRALLAKAESTEYDEEAEALSAKAQELISRHALDRLLQQGEDPRLQAAGEQIVARRIWIDPPYLLAKATLIDAVAGANRCRSVVSELLGFSTVIGDPEDLDAVEILTTSLLVQANTAMLRHGRHVDRSGTSRTRSFRQSFLIAYASRIGERLRATSEEVAATSKHAGALVPVLRRQEERVGEAFGQIFPDVVQRETGVSNGLGWHAGRAAADLALLDTRPHVTPAAGETRE